jgi:hypothetical protein
MKESAGRIAVRWVGFRGIGVNYQWQSESSIKMTSCDLVQVLESRGPVWQMMNGKKLNLKQDV